jgi:acyl-CoA synthetase (AMP-forming)/AMP-acid ligase II
VELNLADLFEAVADALPEREALVVGGTRLTYTDLDARANRLAHVLRHHGITAGDHVGLWLYNGVPYIEGMLAAYKLRAVPVNINYRYGREEMRYLFDDSECRLVLHEPEFSERWAEVVPILRRPPVPVVVDDAYEHQLALASPERDFSTRSADDIYLLYTGGTTGLPKGVMWRHEDIFYAAMGGSSRAGDELSPVTDVVRAAASTPSRRVLAAPPLIHGTAQWAAFTTFQQGGTVVLSADRSFDPASLWRLTADERIGMLVLIGDAFARPLLDALEADPAAWDLSRLRILMSGGAVLAPAVKNGLHRLLPRIRVIDVYGSSESGTQARMTTTNGQTAAVFAVDDHTVVLDEANQPVEPGSGRVGRLARRGHVPLGYYNDPVKTAATFPVIDGVRWAVPGDMATVDADGVVRVLGRGSTCINSGGEKVYPEEVEGVLKSHAGVFDTLVVGTPDDRWGEVVAAVVQPRSGWDLNGEDLQNHVRRQLSGYKVPRRIVFVTSVQRAPSGKADYRWAREVASGVEPATTPDTPDNSDSRTVPSKKAGLDSR